MKEKLDEKDLEMIHVLANLMHENWRKERYNTETNLFTPRIKIVQDKKWIEKHNGISDVDIANTSFEDLPDEWKEENFISAKIAIEKINDVLNLIHDNWLDRNDQHASNDQKTQYSRLPILEKIKDIEVIEEAIKIIKEKTK